jgi:benzoate membrane transport protein
VITFLVTISGVSVRGVGAPFWGLLAGLAVHKFNEIHASHPNR